jgi:hypothetical protein
MTDQQTDEVSPPQGEEDEVFVDEVQEPRISAKDHINAVASDILGPTSIVDRFTNTFMTTALLGGLTGWALLKAYLLAVAISPFLGVLVVAVPLGFALCTGISYIVQRRLQKKGVALA